MYQKCPKCGHARAPDETGASDVCPACGLIFSKYLKARLAPLQRIFLARNRDPFAAAVMLWWCAVAVMDIAPYM
jgi:hypothetical protein